VNELPPDLRTEIPGPKSRAIAARLSAVESPVFDARRSARGEESGEEQSPIVYERGDGANLIDLDGNRYVDLTAGFGALILGHSPKEVIDPVHRAESELLLALGDVYSTRVKASALEQIAQLYPESGARVMLGMSGADAITTALKTALLCTKKPGIVAFSGSYHGLSHGPLAACGLSPKFREPFRDHLSAHVSFAPYPSELVDRSLDESLSHVKRAIASGNIGAILVEPILGRGGCIVPPSTFLRELGALAKESGALLICDEIWTGMGRAGAILASPSEVTADLICVGKGLGAGFPVSACIGKSDAMAAWGEHGGSAIHTATHFGSPGACVAAETTLRILLTTSLIDQARRTGDRFREELARAIPEAEIRGRGMMIGIRLSSAKEALRAARALLRAGYIVLTGGTQGDTLTLTPPLAVSPEILAGFSAQLSRILSLSS